MSESMNTTSSSKELRNKMIQYAHIIKRFREVNRYRNDVWSPSKDLLGSDYQTLSQENTKVHWVFDHRFNGGKFYKEVGTLPANHVQDTSWFNFEDKEDIKTGLWIESEAQLVEKLEQIEANLAGLRSKITENQSKISKTIDVADAMSDLMKMTIDTGKEAVLVQVIRDKLSELEELILGSDLETLCLQKE